MPEIYSLTANGEEESVSVDVADDVKMAYTGRNADGVASQGVNLKEKHFGVRCKDLGILEKKTFSVSFWLKLDKLNTGVTQLLSLTRKADGWPKCEWGWLWMNLTEEGGIDSYTFRGTDGGEELTYRYANTKVPVGAWAHIAYVFDYDASGKFHNTFYVNGVRQEPTANNRTSTADPGYQSGVYNVTDGMVLAIGGDAFGRNGINGAVDNVMVWNKAITDDEVKASMGDIDKKNLPQGVAAFWDFEKSAGSENMFEAVGSLAGTEAGIYEYPENSNDLEWRAPEYTSGCPFLSDTSYKVETRPTWKANHGFVSEAKGNGEAGAANVAYSKAGDYEVTLTLANSLGSAQRTFSVIKVSSTGIGTTETDDVKTYTVGESAIVEFTEAGSYEVNVFNTAGQMEASKAAQLNAGNAMRIHLANKGIYVLTVKKDGKAVRTVKLVRK